MYKTLDALKIGRCIVNKNEELLKKNYRFFKTELPNLLKDDNNKGKFALIESEKIIGIYDTLEQAINVAIEEKKFKLETFLVQKIEKQKVHYISRIA